MREFARDEIDAILARLLDGEPEPEDGEILARAMVADDAFAREVVRFLVLDDLLRQDGLADDAAFVESLEMRLGSALVSEDFLRRFDGLSDQGPSRVISRRRFPWWAAVCALFGLVSVIASITWVGYWKLWPGVARLEQASAPRDERARPNAERPVVAVLTRVVNARWSPGPGLTTDEGSGLGVGRIQLESGLAQIEFLSGASVILEGPCDLDLLSSTRAICHRGKVRAHVPPQARGFTITAHGMDAVDLGTEFAVRVEEGGRGEVHVLEGEVEVRGAAGDGVTTLRTDTGINFGGDGLREIRANPDAFIGRAKILELEEAHQKRRYDGWLAHSRELRSDPAVAVYYGFDEPNTWERSLKDGVGTHDGAVVGCLWCPGRWPGKVALEFKRLSDRVRIDVPGEFQEITLAAWVRVEGLNQWLSSLMLTDGWEPGEVHWQINAKGQLILGVLLGGGPDDGHRSPTVLEPKDLGRWVHLATTYDSRRNVVTHYVNGARVSQGSLPVATAVRIGSANIGNWTAPSTYHEPIRSLNGRIDEFVILKRAMKEQEISRMYEIGKPST